MDDEKLPQRVSVLETQMKDVRNDITEIKEQIGSAATKQDVEDLKRFFEKREDKYGDRMWWITKTLLILFGAAVIIAFGIKQIPNFN